MNLLIERMRDVRQVSTKIDSLNLRFETGHEIFVRQTKIEHILLILLNDRGFIFERAFTHFISQIVWMR